jgi:hypothetical protein
MIGSHAVLPISRAVPGALADLLSASPLSPGKVSFAWATAVGPALARVTTARLEGTRVVVDAANAHWAKEVVRARTLILPRLQRFLGSETVTSIEVRSRR